MQNNNVYFKHDRERRSSDTTRGSFPISTRDIPVPIRITKLYCRFPDYRPLCLLPRRLGVLLAVASLSLLGGCASLDSGPQSGHPQPDQADVQSSAPAMPASPRLSARLVMDSSATQTDDLWARLRAGMEPTLDADSFDGKAAQRIEGQRAWFDTHPDYVLRVTKRAEPFLYLIVEEIEKRNLPLQLALLPVVESGFQPFAYSHGQAAGLWQFIPGTGRHFGLKQNWWYDGRRDVLAATNAALDYLEQLNKQFDGDWLKTLAAYNAGGGNVRKAIRRNQKAGKPTDYWSLDLPRETENYVPRLIAVAELIRSPEKFNQTLYPIANQPHLASVEVGSQIELARAADLAGMDLDELHRLNPGFNQWATDPDGPHRLLLPLTKVDAFQGRLETLPANARVEWRRHTIRKGETLGGIAHHYHTTVHTLRQLNGIRGSNIRSGHALLVPSASAPLSSFSEQIAQVMKRHPAKKPSGNKTVYKVSSGDSLWAIARKYRVKSKDIARWNGISQKAPLQLGQKLVIFNGKSVGGTLKVKTKGMNQKVRYKVRKGDSLYKIAHRFNVTIKQIRQWNRGKIGKYLRPGQTLTLHVDVTRQSAQAPSPIPPHARTSG